MDNLSFNNNQHLNYEDLLAYHKGNLSNREMHRLESHLVSCTLCRDALEGLKNIEESVLEKHLSNIKIKTNSKQEEPVSIRNILAIAASIILIAVVSIVFYNLQKEPPLVAENIPEKVENIPMKEDVNAQANEEIQDTSSRSIQQLIPETKEPVEQPLQNTAEPVVAIVESSPSQDSVEQTISIDTEDISIAEVVVDEKPDSLTTLARTETEPEESVLSSQQPLAALAEQDDSAARSKKVSARTAADTQGVQEAAVSEGNDKPATPEKGQRSYNRYLKRNLNYPVAAKENNVEGDVVLQVIISDDGTVMDIVVIKSIGYGCDKEAIRLVKEGPQWVPGQQAGQVITDTVNVTVRFKL